MKLLLASSTDLNELQKTELLRLIGKEKAERVLVITTAVVPYGLVPKPEWFERSLVPLQEITEEIVETSLEEGTFTPEDLIGYDFIYVSGGNTFYLAYRLQQTGWDQKLRDFIKAGGVYTGSSAGSIIMMDNIEYFASADDPSKAPHLSPGLGLVKEAIIPHADNIKYVSMMTDIADMYRHEGREIILLNDNQVLVINGNERVVI